MVGTRSIGGLLMLLLAAAGCATNGTTAQPAGEQVGVHQDEHEAAPEARAAGGTPEPPADATSATSIGEGDLSVSAADTGSFWVEELDLLDDGQVEEVDLLWDDEAKVLYLFGAETFTCADGVNEGAGGVLVAIYDADNADDEPAGSGWYLVELDAAECDAQSDTLWGCEFDANGEETDCGLASLDTVTGDILLLEASAME